MTEQTETESMAPADKVKVAKYFREKVRIIRDRRWSDGKWPEINERTRGLLELADVLETEARR